MKPNISEFSYGYAITDELVHSGGSQIVGAPVFPSLYDEGQPGGGWDLKLNRPSVPLFLQFKLSHFMKTKGCREHKSGLLNAPCYRMHLRPTRLSSQHDLLLDLEGKGHEVYYSAPAFHEPHELDEAYSTCEVRQRSLWIRPSKVGPLPDVRDHHISFHHPGQWFLFSDPKHMEGPKDYESFERRMIERLKREGHMLIADESFVKLAEDVLTLAERWMGHDGKKRDVRSGLRDAHPIRQAAYVAATFFECRMFLITWRTGADAIEVGPGRP